MLHTLTRNYSVPTLSSSAYITGGLLLTTSRTSLFQSRGVAWHPHFASADTSVDVHIHQRVGIVVLLYSRWKNYHNQNRIEPQKQQQDLTLLKKSVFSQRKLQYRVQLSTQNRVWSKAFLCKKVQSISVRL